MAKLALFLDHSRDRRNLEAGFYLVRRGQAQELPAALGDEAVFLRGGSRDETRYAGIGRLAGLRPVGGDREVLRLDVDVVRQLEALPLNLHADAPPMMALTDEQFIGLRRQLGDRLERTGDELTEAGGQSPYVAPTTAKEATLAAFIASVRRDAENTCAVTGEVVPARALRIAIIRPKPFGGALHANNFIALTKDADEAFMAGHFSVRNDFRLIVDWSRLKPALRGRINASGRLRVSANPALRPSPDNLDYHRRFVFGLG